MTTALDPSLVTRTHDELVAVETGYVPLQEEIARALGEFSLTASNIHDRQSEISTGNANLAFVKRFIQLLPMAEKDVFTISAEEQDGQYLARQIQANVLWVNKKQILNSRYADESPYYLIGRAPGEPGKNETKLLLIPASKEGDPIIINVQEDDMDFRDRIAERIKNTEFDSQAAEELIDSRTGNLIIGSSFWKSTDGCIKLRGPHRGKSDEKQVEKKGVRVTYQYRSVVPLEALTPEMLEEYEVPTRIAKLATTFGLGDKLRLLISGDNFERRATVEDVLQQNEELRSALERIMLASGILSEEQVNSQLDKQFPRLKT